MPQITIYLDQDVLDMVDSAVRNSGISKSKWISDAVRARVKRDWPDAVRELAGSWPDFPDADEIRRRHGRDARRETL